MHIRARKRTQYGRLFYRSAAFILLKAFHGWYTGEGEVKGAYKAGKTPPAGILFLKLLGKADNRQQRASLAMQTTCTELSVVTLPLPLLQLVKHAINARDAITASN